MSTLLRNGPNVMIYPGAFEPYPRGTSQHCSYSVTMSYNGETFTEVHLPSRYNLPFEHIRLTTSDNVKLHAYLLLHPAKSKRVSDKIDSPTSINSHSQQDVCVLGCRPCFFPSSHFHYHFGITLRRTCVGTFGARSRILVLH